MGYLFSWVFLKAHVVGKYSLLFYDLSITKLNAAKIQRSASPGTWWLKDAKPMVFSSKTKRHLFWLSYKCEKSSHPQRHLALLNLDRINLFTGYVMLFL
jgi:hypothetical protein